MHVYMDNNNDALYSNSDDSLSSDTSFNTGSNNASHVNEPANKLIPEQSIKVNKCSVNEVSETKHNEEVEINKEDSEAFLNPVPSTSSHYNGQAQYSNNCSQRELVLGDSASCTKSALVGDLFSRIDKEINSQLLPIVSSKEQILCHLPSQGRSSISPSVICFPSLDDKKEKFVANPAAFSCKERNDFNDDAWGDSEGGSDDEVCTCLIYSNETGNYMDKELPSRDVDLSGFIESVSMSDNLLLSGNALAGSSLQRKRKLRETQVNDFHRSYLTSPLTARKRIALENASCSSTCNSPADLPIVNERKLPSRLVIPTKENPPPELESWIAQFQRWSHVERLLAVDKLIEHCEPTQVRHMMKVIEPQFQRDFISLLPKELALQVLSYLEPKDLLRAAQTCRSWRFLCDDNLLWKEKCKQAHILPGPNSDKPKRGRAGNMPAISSTWKAAFIRQHIIETNWRSRPIREPKVLKGHDDHVITCLQFQGSRIVSGSDDNTLKVWSAISGKCLRTLVGHTGGVWSSQMSENVIVSGSTDRTLKVWNIDTGQCIHTLQGHTSTVRCMHLHGKKVVSGSRDATLRVWDVEKGICLHLLEGHQAAVRCVQYDGKFVVSGAYDYMVRVWIPEREECLHTLKGHTNRVYSLQFDGIHIVSGSLDTTIRVWDAETGSCKHTLKGHQSLTSGMELRDNILVSGNADSTVKVWDITTGQCLQTLSGPNKHQSAVTCLQFNSRFVITSSDDGTVKLWDVKSGEFIRNLVSLESGGSGGVVWRIRTSDTKLVCAVGSRNGTEETKLMVLDFDVDGACAKCS